MKTTTNFRTLRMVQLALLIAIIIIMNLTPLGYIRTLGLSITIVGIPVIIGAIVLGPAAGAILGGVFGITSFIQCFGLEPFGTMLFGINPVFTFIICMVPRILMGGLTGLIFKSIKKVDKTKGISFAVTGLLGSLLNTILFMSALVLFFYKTPQIQQFSTELGSTNVFAFVILFVGFNIVAEAILGLIVGGGIAKAIDTYNAKQA